MIPFWFYLASLAVVVGVALQFHRQATRRRLVEQAERHQERDALVGTIATGIAHEIRNPLSTLTMNLQLLMEDWKNPVTEREQRSVRKLEVLLREIRRLESVLNAFLRFAAGHQLKLDRVQVNALLGELLDFMLPQAEKGNIRFRREFAAALPQVEIDANLIRQSVMNLLINAQQAMATGGEIRVRTTAEGGLVKIAVQDNGPGIPAEHLDQIFQIYFSTKPSGTGLGLPMARKIVEEHRGTLTVASEPGKGATFTLSLPALDDKSRA